MDEPTKPVPVEEAPPAGPETRAGSVIYRHRVATRLWHWVNALTLFIMIGSGWKIYNDEVIFGWLHFPEALTIGFARRFATY